MRRGTKEWLQIAESDYKASLYLFKGAHYPQAVYAMCQALEKILKASQIEIAKKRPQKIHILKSIARETKLEFSDKQLQILDGFSGHYGRVRYPDYSRKLYNTKAKVLPIINQGKNLYLWILKQLKDH